MAANKSFRKYDPFIIGPDLAAGYGPSGKLVDITSRVIIIKIISLYAGYKTD
jgi:hypothetical protein